MGLFDNRTNRRLTTVNNVNLLSHRLSIIQNSCLIICEKFILKHNIITIVKGKFLNEFLVNYSLELHILETMEMSMHFLEKVWTQNIMKMFCRWKNTIKLIISTIKRGE